MKMVVIQFTDGVAHTHLKNVLFILTLEVDDVYLFSCSRNIYCISVIIRGEPNDV
jgi:hypothetical protein